MGRLHPTWRWAAAVVATAAVVAVPATLPRRPASAHVGDLARLLSRAAASARVGYEGDVTTVGTLGLPDLGWLHDTAGLLGSTSQLRVWWRGPQSYRVDLLEVAGERDAYRAGSAVTSWDSGHLRVTTGVAADGPHLPVAADLTPPELGRRLLRAAAAGEVRLAGIDPVAGRAAARVEVVPADRRALAGRIDVWLDPGTGLPVRVAVVPRGAPAAALTSGFSRLRLHPPAASVLRFVAPADAVLRVADAPAVTDLASRSPAVPLPPVLGGLPRRGDAGGGTGVATYGRGYVLVAVVPLSGDDARTLVDRYTSALHPVDHRDYGDEIALRTPLLTAVLVAGAGRGWALAGTVPTRDLESLARALARVAP